VAILTTFSGLFILKRNTGIIGRLQDMNNNRLPGNKIYRREKLFA
jgi:hypothetical protein